MNIHTLVVIIANLLFSMRGFKDYSFFEQYKFNIGALQRGEKIRMISSGFLHVNWQHFMFNMISLYLFAHIVIYQLGTLNFYLVYLFSLLAGNLLSFYFHKNEPFYSAVGASGAVTGIVYSAILLRPDMHMFIYFIPVPIPSYVVGVGYLLFSIYGMKTKLGNIGHDAHFGGAVGGYFMTLFLAPWIFEYHFWMVALLAAPIGLLLFLKWKNKL
ncbi:MAG: rhomboid family intramembrane serine protease [Bacteroidetes bacterium]|nr:rhomboid family intramembrane serine protease [Bacteroidota bacterium]MDA0859487.1 rhomboid family intramembrane serine protease [Bacteroidota bacterium]MDA1317926.1 rhomboid family intramembrane serine protease [Bacteroidota bacterium]